MDSDSSEQLFIIEKPNNQMWSCYTVMQIIFPVVGGFLFGYDTGVISGAMLLIRKYFSMGTFLQEVVVSATIFACAISALVAGVLAEKIGRRKTMFISSITLTIGSILLCASINTIMLIIGRIIVGIGVGICATCCPIYIAEVSPEKVRGRLVLLYNLSITFGQFFAAVVDALLYPLGRESWRVMLGFAAIPAIIQGIGLFLIPESYRWLLSKGKTEEAKKIIIKDNRIQSEMVDDYIQSIIEENKRIEDQTIEHKSDKTTVLSRIFHNPLARRTLLIGCVLQMFQQIVGINTIMYYAASVIRMSGVQNISTILWLAAVVALFNFLPSFIGFALVDKIGRRKLAIISLTGVLAGLILLAITFQAMSAQSAKVLFNSPFGNESDDLKCASRTTCENCITTSTCGFCYLTDNNNSVINSTCLVVRSSYSDYSRSGWCSKKSVSKTTNFRFMADYCASSISWIIVVGMILYLFSFSIGMGPIPWIITSEIYPLWCRGISMSISTAVNWFFNVLISLTFLSLTETITKYGTFWLYSVFAVACLVFLSVWLPETNQKTLEDISNTITLS